MANRFGDEAVSGATATAPPSVNRFGDALATSATPPAPSFRQEIPRLAGIAMESSGQKLATDLIGSASKGFMDWATGSPSDPRNTERFKQAGQSLMQMVKGEPYRIGAHLVKSGEALVRGDINAAADQLWFAVPIAGAAGEAMKDYLEKGDYLGAFTHGVATLAPVATKETKPIAKATIEAGRTAVPYVAAGAKGAVAESLAPSSVKIGKIPVSVPVPRIISSAVTGKVAGSYLAGPPGGYVGMAVGAATPIVRGATRSIQELRKARATQAAEALRTQAGARPQAVPVELQLPPGPIIPPEPPDASYVRSVPGGYAMPEAIPPSRQLPMAPPAREPIVTPPPDVPPDASFVRSTSATPAEVLPQNLRANPQAEAAARQMREELGLQPIELETQPTAESFAEQARAEKTAKLTEFIVDKKIPSSMIDQFGEKEWGMVAREAKVNPPSAETQAAVRAKVAEYEAGTTPPAKEIPVVDAEVGFQAERQAAKGVTGIIDSLDNASEAALERMRKRGTFSGTKLNAGIPVEDMADMAIWGASKLAKGTVQFAQWSKELLTEAGPAAERLRPLLPKLYEASQKAYERYVKTTVGKLPNTQRILEMHRKGKAGMEWYTETKAELRAIFGDDTDMFVNFLAATSPNTTVAANTALALKAYTQWKTGKPFTGYLPTHAKMLEQAIAGEDFGSLKVRSFRKNLHGDPIPVTVDRWIARAFGFKDSPTAQQYKFVDYLITQLAEKKGVEPRQMQAAIWKTIKDAEGLASQGGESYEVLVRRKLLKDPDLAEIIKKVAPAQ